MPAKLWADFERLTASDLNTYLAQQVVAVFANAAARNAAIPAPVEGQIAYLIDVRRLTVYRAAAWRELASEAAFAILRHSANQSIPNNTATKQLFDTVVEDSHGFALGNNELTVPTGQAGIYDIGLSIYWAAQTTAAGLRTSIVQVNGVDAGIRHQDGAHNAIAKIDTISGIRRLADADKVSAIVLQASGGALNSTSDPIIGPFLRMHRIGP